MDEETFLAAMRAEPAKLSLRLLFADWQEENCRPDRATFLRLQCEQAGLLNRNERFQRIADEKQRLIPQVSWAWAKQVGQPRFPLLGQILTSPLNEYGWSHETWSMVVGETDEFVDVVSIEHDSSGRRPSLTPIDGRESRLRKHYF
ncbi:MAG TPA: TIGR02996 domain-containing protein, partial [Pirellulales bacterium]